MVGSSQWLIDQMTERFSSVKRYIYVNSVGDSSALNKKTGAIVSVLPYIICAKFVRLVSLSVRGLRPNQTPYFSINVFIIWY